MDFTLDAVEARVLGSLVEKELSTPEYYPMTVNALTAACNQKTNRDPVVSYTDEDVVQALTTLQRKRLAGTASGAHLRATKYRHSLREALSLSEPELALIAELLLRGPQTLGELRGRAGRMRDFDSLEAVERLLEGMTSREQPLLVRLPRFPGQKEARYAHLLSGEPDPGAAPAQAAAGSDRMSRMEEEVADLRSRVQELEEQFRQFRQQFE